MKPSPRWRYSVALVLPLLFGCTDNGTGPEENTDPQPTPENPLNRFVTVAPGVDLHYLDFGGEGDPILLLAGKGNTANVFRDLAPLLTDDHRVRALTRRGYGRSDQPSTGYDRPTLAADIAAVLDSLGIQTVHLVGHSVAGEEMSRFGVDHAGRLGRLVYLDAAYDRTLRPDDQPGSWATPPAPTAADVASATAFQAYLAGVIGVQFPLAEVTATTVSAGDGTVVGYVTPPAIGQAMSDAVEAPDYPAIAASALAIYAVPVTPADIAPWLSPDAVAAWDSAQAWIDSVVVPFRRAQAALFDSLMADGTVLELEGANHYVFLDEQSRVAGEILAFLGGG